ncbi:MAG: Flavonol 3-sulfotransferase, partial [candidate division NC10 bacterium]|nr:Flavonol 3-sulfotransferase [candidate division NC10 bacterium]
DGILARMIDPSDVWGWRNNTDWSAFYGHWLSAASGPTTVIHYEELVRRPLEVIWNALVGLIGYLVVPRTLAPLPSFAEFHRQEPGFFRSGKIGAWKEEFSPELEAMFWHHHGKMMLRLGYER